MARIFISIGSNIDAEHYFNVALKALTDHFSNLCLSSVFESEAVGFKGSNFLNMVVAGDTPLSVAQVVALFKRIEQDNGRSLGAKKYSPRTLDLDLLLYDDWVGQIPVELPRAEITTNAFVLWPLAEIAPTLLHPVEQQTYQTLWDNFDKSQQKLWPIEFHWCY
ncbi:2-amino-4-hydroxy-6-hydroxymethyldihydropteridine diphosphokinase [Shewanella algidipiscicola]|uniref:2-amino-4-hydroxy-6-hydroxymethyldihydropteridine diphosphokinase n=1 Tax=Shewanella algidipiscicola TaxID=614070 RepID=A0ABQ4P9W6_9GAMM|nr:2-amino-4-hydroxy-6-hydroxymethyldihydropteridine diphosphokinase [Shewanella algidipiscicola]GIU44298.1 2-amino-4-hydroxy-6-hydroxymethyldihydropteridine diphosphokinase [Shewanella algidipiscicola]